MNSFPTSNGGASPQPLRAENVISLPRYDAFSSHKSEQPEDSLIEPFCRERMKAGLFKII